LPADVAVFAAAVADWRIAKPAPEKIKKTGGRLPRLELTANPDILATIAAAGNLRPRLVIGFAAETERVIDNALAKRAAKDCDWMLANDVSSESGTFGGDYNTIHVVSADGVESWPRLTKTEVAERLAARIEQFLATPT
jgi:phosphopantothenoylcysteine decarboxylase/phosphopantothenate--cysteine ligase